jgi:hypothetical protein
MTVFSSSLPWPPLLATPRLLRWTALICGWGRQRLVQWPLPVAPR